MNQAGFSGWSAPAGFTVTPPASYTVTFCCYDFGSGTYAAIGGTRVTNGGTYGPLYQPSAHSGYLFEGWYTDMTGGERITEDTVVNLSGDQNLYERWTRIVTDTQAPSISNLRAANVSGSSFTLCYDLSDNVGVTRGMVNVYGPNGTQNSYEVSASDGAFTHTVYTANYAGPGSYDVQLFAYDAAGNRTSERLNGIRAADAPNAPVISLSYVSDGNVSIDIHNVPGAVKYELTRKESGDWYPIDVIDVNPYWDYTGYYCANAPRGVNTSFRVRAISEQYTYSDYSNVLTLVIPPVPGGLTVTPENGKMVLRWNAVPGASGYYIYNRNRYQRVEVTGTTWTDENITSGVEYSYKVCAFNGSGSGSYSEFVSATAPGGIWVDLDALVDGEVKYDIAPYATVDVYINGQLAADNVTDYLKQWEEGTIYALGDIRPAAGYSFDGFTAPYTRTGTVGGEYVFLRPSFSTIRTDDLPAAAANGVYNGHRYAYFDHSVNWYYANAYCEAMGGYLAAIGSAEENEYVNSLCGGDMVWLGATDAAEEGVWRWPDGQQVVYENWSYLNPNNYPENDEGRENYLTMNDVRLNNREGYWSDSDGCWKSGFICEFDEPGETKILRVDTTGQGTSATVFCAKENAYVICAVYDTDGRLTGTEIKPAAAGESSYSFSLEAIGRVKVFVLDVEYKPLCGCEPG